MGNTSLSRPLQLSIGFSRILLLLLNAARHVLWWGLGLLALAFIPVLIFESADGLRDISPAEWGFLLLWLLLVKRHIRRCGIFQYGFWAGLDRFLKAQGLLAVAFLATTGLCFTFVAIAANAETRVLRAVWELQQSLFYSKPSELTLLLLFLLTSYLATPVQPRQAQRVDTTDGIGGPNVQPAPTGKPGLPSGAPLLSLLLALCLWLPAPSGHASPAYRELAQSCQELLALNGRKDTPLVALTTSVSEAMKAGYCLGVIDQYRAQSHYRCRNNRLAVAQSIVQASMQGAQPEEALKRACNG